MKGVLYLVFLLSFFTHSARADGFSTCRSLFIGTPNVQKPLAIHELAAIYYANYLKTPEGQAHIKKIQDILDTKITLKPLDSSFFEFRVRTKEELPPEKIETIREYFPEINIIYYLNELNYKGHP
jgi:hypothetical protein